MKHSISILGSGWLGFPLIKKFAELGHHIKASTTTEHKIDVLLKNGAEPYLIDISDLKENIYSFLNSEILIINITSKNIDHFKMLLNHIPKSRITKVIFIGSTSIYKNMNRVITEDDKLETKDHPLYLIENLFRENKNIETTVIRFGGLIGFSRHPGKFYSVGKSINDPEAFVNLIHRDDCIEIIVRVVEQNIWNEDFNCCADTHPTRREFYSKAAETIDRPPPTFIESEKVDYKIISNQKMKSKLNYSFLHSDLMKVEF